MSVGVETPNELMVVFSNTISAGFDAHRRDPLAHQSLEAEDFAWATRAIVEIARRRCGGKVVSSLEGGYDLEGLGRSSSLHVQALGED